MRKEENHCIRVEEADEVQVYADGERVKTYYDEGDTEYSVEIHEYND